MTFRKSSADRLTVEQVEERRLQKASFPNQGALGSFTPHSTIIEVAAFRLDEVVAAQEKGNLLGVRQDIQVLCHEMTHWFDFFGTVWGRGYGREIGQAYAALQEATEAGFSTLIGLFDIDRRILTPDYYRFARQPVHSHHPERPWGIQITSGAEIDPFGNTDEGRPIFMVGFVNNPRGDVFARQPISIGALLEVRAIASEIMAGSEVIGTETDRNVALVEESQMRRELYRLAYDHDLVEYNAALHVLAHQTGISDIYLAAGLASRLAYVALNMQDEDFDRLAVPDNFAVFGARNSAFIKNRDRGFAFACMVWNGGRYPGDEDAYVSQCISKSNLDGDSAILERAAEFLEEPADFGKGGAISFHFFREASLAASAVENFIGQRHHALSLKLLLEDLKFLAPPFMHSEGEFFELHEGRLDEYQPSIIHDASVSLRQVTYNLLSGCRGFPAQQV